MYAVLSLYEINETNVSKRLKDEWIKEIAEDVIKIIYNGQDATSRIAQINNRLLIHISNYSTFVINKTFNT